jgi:hypothetical protein
MATIIVRALDANGDPRRGAGLSNFLTDIDAVAQILATRMRMLQGEWFEDVTAGTPAFQQLLGHPTTSDAVALILRQRILATPYVTGILTMQVVYQPAGRNFSFFATVQTLFGQLNLTNQEPRATVGPTPSGGGALSLASLTNTQLGSLTNAQLESMTN